MKLEYERKLIAEKYHTLEIQEIPVSLIAFAALQGYNLVTVENFNHYRLPDITELALKVRNKWVKPKLKKFYLDFEFSKNDFLKLMDVWDIKGCYAIFHNKPLKFKVTDLNNIPRYRALDNFEWNLEIAVPDGSSDGWGQFVSPFKYLIDEIEKKIISNTS